MRGKGSGATNKSGDLFVVVNITDHPYYRRRGMDIFCDVPVSWAQALLGAELEVPTLFGTSIIRLPPGTQPGAVLTMKGKGMPRLKGGGPKAGDQFVKVLLDMPDSVSDEQKAAILALDQQLSSAPSAVRNTYEDVLHSARMHQEESSR